MGKRKSYCPCFPPSLLYISVVVPNIGKMDRCSFSLRMKKKVPLLNQIFHWWVRPERGCHLRLFSKRSFDVPKEVFDFWFLIRWFYPLSRLKTKRSVILEWTVVVTSWCWRFNHYRVPKSFVHYKTAGPVGPISHMWIFIGLQKCQFRRCLDPLKWIANNVKPIDSMSNSCHF